MATQSVCAVASGVSWKGSILTILSFGQHDLGQDVGERAQK
jgi:hypothetical protein